MNSAMHIDKNTARRSLIINWICEWWTSGVFAWACDTLYQTPEGARSLQKVCCLRMWKVCPMQ